MTTTYQADSIDIALVLTVLVILVASVSCSSQTCRVVNVLGEATKRICKFNWE
jgi:hypothetical protein